MALKVVERNPRLPHQIQLVFVVNKVYVTCNCRRKGDEMGPAPTVEEAWKLYNNPLMHKKR